MIGVSDGDGDRLRNAHDRSVGVLNPEPLDGEGDGFANACDFHQDGICDIADFHTFLPDFRSGVDGDRAPASRARAWLDPSSPPPETA